MPKEKGGTLTIVPQIQKYIIASQDPKNPQYLESLAKLGSCMKSLYDLEISDLESTGDKLIEEGSENAAKEWYKEAAKAAEKYGQTNKAIRLYKKSGILLKTSELSRKVTSRHYMESQEALLNHIRTCMERKRYGEVANIFRKFLEDGISKLFT